MKEQFDKLVFVYNADSDVLNSVLGYMHKVFSPRTYPCDLCSLTHSNIGERKAWRGFKGKQDVRMDFIYKKEFNESFKIETALPVILAVINGLPAIIMSKEEIASIEGLDELMESLSLKLQTIK